jgi:inner membrane protein
MAEQRSRLLPRWLGSNWIVMASSHVAVGVAAWTWTAPHLGLSSLNPEGLVLAAVGALLPDIDHPGSWVGRRLSLISVPLAAMLGHRGVTHSLVAVLACMAFLRWEGLSNSVVAPLVIGYLSHLGADLLTTNGLRLAWPSSKRHSIGVCRTGSVTESVIVAGVVLAAGINMMHIHQAFGP